MPSATRRRSSSTAPRCTTPNHLGLLQPGGSTESATSGRAPVVTTWRLFTATAIGTRERVVWQERAFEVTGDSAVWSPHSDLFWPPVVPGLPLSMFEGAPLVGQADVVEVVPPTP